LKKSAYETAVSLIAKRDYCSFELNKKLLRKGFSEEEIQKVVDSLISSGYIDNQKIMHEMIKKRLDKHPEGKKRLRAYLCSKGIPENQADSVLLKFPLELIVDRFCDWIRNNPHIHEKSELIKCFRTRGIDEDEAECIYRELGDDIAE